MYQPLKPSMPQMTTPSPTWSSPSCRPRIIDNPPFVRCQRNRRPCGPVAGGAPFNLIAESEFGLRIAGAYIPTRERGGSPVTNNYSHAVPERSGSTGPLEGNQENRWNDPWRIASPFGWRSSLPTFRTGNCVLVFNLHAFCKGRCWCQFCVRIAGSYLTVPKCRAR